MVGEPTRVPLRYPCITSSSSEHCAHDYMRKIEAQNMFWIKPTIITTIVAKSFKPNDVSVNVVVVVATCNQVL